MLTCALPCCRRAIASWSRHRRLIRYGESASQRETPRPAVRKCGAGQTYSVRIDMMQAIAFDSSRELLRNRNLTSFMTQFTYTLLTTYPLYDISSHDCHPGKAIMYVRDGLRRGFARAHCRLCTDCSEFQPHDGDAYKLGSCARCGDPSACHVVPYTPLPPSSDPKYYNLCSTNGCYGVVGTRGEPCVLCVSEQAPDQPVNPTPGH